MKKLILYSLATCLILLSGCSFFETDTPLTKEDAQQVALTCFEDYKEDMKSIIQSGTATGEPKWCLVYNLLSNGEYEFILQQTGFTGTNTKTGILYIPNDAPHTVYIQDKTNANLYSYESGYTDKFYLERIEKNWFFFYSKYDF